MTKLHTLDEAAEILRCGKEQVRRWIKDQEIDAIPMGRGKQRQRWLISQDALDAFLMRRTRPANPKPNRRQTFPPTKQYI